MNPLVHYLRYGLLERRGRTATGALGGVPAAMATPWLVRRLNQLASRLDAKTYLEIGVADGVTFRAVMIEERTGVDPRFGFDTRSVTDARTVLVESESDAFFASLPRERTFDVCFIDGLHTFTQAYRDLINCLAHAGPRSAFLIDDTVPSDRHSALPDQVEALRSRMRAGGGGNAWHGDVYKVVFAIHDLHPELEYRTIMGSGNPQTLVWQAVGRGRTARVGSIGRISALTYPDLQRNRDLLREATEAEALDACVQAVGSPVAARGG